MRIPVTEMIEIGAGGGSIASVDALSRLRIGPRSAGSDPGPACYGRGGIRPTVTDADAVAGYLDPDAFAEGRLRLDLDLARRAIERDIGAGLGTGATDDADGISQMVDEAMANAARMHAVEQGKNLEDCAMVAFGGNGPLHAVRVAEKVGVREIVVPPNPGAGSAVGFLSAPVSFEVVRSHYVRVADFDAGAVDALLEDMRSEAAAVVEAGSGGAPLEVTRTAFMRYRGQGHEIEVGVPRRALDAAGVAHLVAAFEADYTRLYGRIVPGVAIEVMNWSVRVSTTPEAPPRAGDCARPAAPEPVGARTLTLDHSGDADEGRLLPPGGPRAGRHGSRPCADRRAPDHDLRVAALRCPDRHRRQHRHDPPGGAGGPARARRTRRPAVRPRPLARRCSREGAGHGALVERAFRHRPRGDVDPPPGSGRGAGPRCSSARGRRGVLVAGEVERENRDRHRTR